MAGASKIEWTDASWNPVRGCTKVSPGCKHCYAETFAERWRGVAGHPYERGFDPRFVPDQLDAPLHWRKPRKVFVNSMSDLFHEAFTNEQIAAVFGAMACCSRHTFQVLTKRAARLPAWFDWLERMGLAACMEQFSRATGRVGMIPWEWPLPNVVLMVSAENQEQADKRLPHLMATPAAVRGVSVEPMLGPVDLYRFLRWTQVDDGPWPRSKIVPRLDWVIAGSESGHGARPMNEDWVRSLRDQCAAAGVAFMYKQRLERGRKVSLPLLDGVQHAEMPR